MSRNSSIEESSAWGEGYDAGQAGLAKAIETTELLATKRERDRIIQLIENELAKHIKVLEFNPNRQDADVRNTICRILQVSIDIIKGEYK